MRSPRLRRQASPLAAAFGVGWPGDGRRGGERGCGAIGRREVRHLRPRAVASSSTQAPSSTPSNGPIRRSASSPCRPAAAIENVPLLQEGKLDIGLVFGEVAQQLFNPKEGRRPLKVICAVYSAPACSSCGPTAAIAPSPISRAGRSFWGQAVRQLALQARYVMDALDLDPGQGLPGDLSGACTDGPTMLIEAVPRRCGVPATAGRASSRSPATARRALHRARHAEQIARIVAKYPSSTLTVPAGRYPGQYEPLSTRRAWSYILARPDLDDLVGYRWRRAHKAERPAACSPASSPQTTARTRWPRCQSARRAAARRPALLPRDQRDQIVPEDFPSRPPAAEADFPAAAGRYSTTPFIEAGDRPAPTVGVCSRLTNQSLPARRACSSPPTASPRCGPSRPVAASWARWSARRRLSAVLVRRGRPPAGELCRPGDGDLEALAAALGARLGAPVEPESLPI